MNDELSNELQALHCPACGAALSPTHKSTVRCEYCESVVSIPRSHRQQREAHQVTVVHTSRPIIVRQEEPDEPPARSGGIAALGVLLFLLVTSAVACITLVPGRTAQLSDIATFIEQILITQVATQVSSLEIFIDGVPVGPSAPLATATAQPFASFITSFGEPGSAPGQMEDIRSIAVDAQGNIYISSYSNGLVQKFSPAGDLIWHIRVTTEDGDDAIIYNISLDDLGILYAASDGDILRYNTNDGSPAGIIPDLWPTIYFNYVQAANGVLYSFNGMAGTDDIIQLSLDGRLLQHWQEVIETVNNDDPALNLDAAVDSQGNIYVISNFGASVYVYDKDGKFQYRFGEEGNAPGQLGLDSDVIALDSQGRVYIVSSNRLDRFDKQGHLLASFQIPYDESGGALMDLFIDNQDNLYLASFTKVLIYRLQENNE